jgi:purine-binding chemotaxis protein CheW
METPKQYLTLKVGDTTYGIAINKVREVVVYERPSPMPNGSDCMAGIINLRGRAVTVLDLRKKFGLADTIPTVDTCIIILEMHINDEAALVGIIADTVQEVAEFGSDDMEPAPHVTSGKSTTWIHAMARIENGFVIILDIDKTLEEETCINIGEEDIVQEKGQDCQETSATGTD